MLYLMVDRSTGLNVVFLGRQVDKFVVFLGRQVDRFEF